MAAGDDSAVTGKDAAAMVFSTDTRLQANGDHRQVVAIGDGTAASTALVRASGEMLVGHTDLFGTGTITAADVATVSTAGAGGQNLLTGAPTAASFVSMLVDGETSFAVQVTGIFVATYTVDRSLDGGVTWTIIGAFPAGTNAPGQVWTAPGVFHGNASSCTHLRVRCTAFTSGSLAVRILVGHGAGTITIGNPIRLYDGVSQVQASIKAGSTPAVAADTGIVVTDHPQSGQSSTSTVTSVAASATSVAVIAANTARKGLTLHSGSGSAVVYVRMGAAAAAAAAGGHSLDMSAGAYLEVPFRYTGAITAIWASAAGFLNVTEYT